MEKTNLEEIEEVIGQAVYEMVSDQDIDNLNSKVSKFLNLARESYVIVQWPEVQELMDEEWFDEESVLDVDCKFGDSAYFIPLYRLI